MSRVFAFCMIGASLLAGAGGCSSSSSDAPPAPDPARAQMSGRKTLEDLAAFGSKRAGTDADRAAGDYVLSRLGKAGLDGVHTEEFSFPAYTVKSVALTTSIDGQSIPMKPEAFAYSGAGHVDADVVSVGLGHEQDYAGKDVTGKIALVQRDPTFHRGAQYAVMEKHGAAAMLYLSTAPGDLVQVGSLGPQDGGLGKIPAITVSAQSGQQILDAVTAGKPVHAVLDVDAELTPARGRNVIGRIPGTDPSGGYVLVGAHYDTWFTGSTDNGTGVAALLAIADDLGKRRDLRLGLVFVGYDAEELGLYGGYDYLREHVVVGHEKMLGFLHFEIPANHRDGAQILAHTPGPIDDALLDTEASRVYQLYSGMELLPAVLGGIIPTDIQGMYWSGIQGATTVCTSPYYHTTEDTPDKVDLELLGDSIAHFEEALAEIDRAPVDAFAARDPHVWNPDVTTTPQANGDLEVRVTAKDANAKAQPSADVTVVLEVDGFTRVFQIDTQADDQGAATITIPADRLAQGAGDRFVSVRVGSGYPRAERVVPIP